MVALTAIPDINVFDGLSGLFGPHGDGTAAGVSREESGRDQVVQITTFNPDRVGLQVEFTRVGSGVWTPIGESITESKIYYTAWYDGYLYRVRQVAPSARGVTVRVQNQLGIKLTSGVNSGYREPVDGTVTIAGDPVHLLSDTPLAGVVPAGYSTGTDRSTGTSYFKNAAGNWQAGAGGASTPAVKPIVRNATPTTNEPTAAELTTAGDANALSVEVIHDDIDTIVVWERTTTAAPWAAVASTDDTVAPSPYDLEVAYAAPQDRPPLLAELTAAGVNAETPDGSLFTKVLSDGRVEIYKLTANVWGLHRVELTPSAGAALVDSVTAQTYPAGTIIKVDPTHEIVFDQTVSNYYWTIPKNDWSEHTQDAGNGGTYSSPGVTTHAAGQDLPKTGNSIILWGYNPVTDNWEASFNKAVSSGTGTTEPQRNSETIQMVTGTSIYALPEGVVSNSDLQRMTAILQGAGGLVRGESYTVAGATLTLLPPTSALVDNTMKLQVTY